MNALPSTLPERARDPVQRGCAAWLRLRGDNPAPWAGPGALRATALSSPLRFATAVSMTGG